MGAFGPVHWIVLGLVVLLVFGGRGKLSGLMGDAAKGVRAFREGLKGDDEAPAAEEPTPAPPLPKPAARASAPRTTKARTAAKPAAKPRAKTKA